MQKSIQPIACQLLCSSSAEHLSQIFTGFGLLERQGLVRNQLTRLSGYTAGPLAPPRLRVILNGHIKMVYDTFDGGDVDETELEWCDFYFKRSFDISKHASKIYPLGFNYSVYGPNDYSFLRLIYAMISLGSLADIKKVFHSLSRLTALSYFLKTSSGKSNAWYSKFEDLPHFSVPPQVIFFTRLWDPKRTEKAHLQDERDAMNQMRVEIIRKMRRNFGGSFLGGLEPTPFSLRYYKDYVVRDRRITYKKNYLRLLRQSDIGIATTGLMKSNGWRIAEYIAGAKAIVSERLFYQVPGDFEESKNFLAFKTSDEAVEQVAKLMNNLQMRYEMMTRNYVYYHLYLRPDILVWNTIRIAISTS